MAACTCCPYLSTTWRILAPDPPLAVRRCRRCDRARPFRSSGRFRVNANGRRLDIWLVYRCTACEASWNRPVHERVDLPWDVAGKLDADLQLTPRTLEMIVDAFEADPHLGIAGAYLSERGPDTQLARLRSRPLRIGQLGVAAAGHRGPDVHARAGDVRLGHAVLAGATRPAGAGGSRTAAPRRKFP